MAVFFPDRIYHWSRKKRRRNRKRSCQSITHFIRWVLGAGFELMNKLPASGNKPAYLIE
ncbi:hypothetical protein [Sinorhizobium meliloti]|uniref:hypothetical protein n=1 Tax=Rhizobium meliloti TaxID=382 RepID=UPI001F24943C|nr:hypothetical protein [Sinorhizobium meliloti]